MITPEQVKASYQRAIAICGEDIAIRRFSGPPASRTHMDTTVRARVTGYQPQELVGPIVQGDRKVICLVDTISALLPITDKDALVIRGKEVAIKSVDDNTRRYGALIALDIRATA